MGTIFLSHSSRDEAAASDLAQRLKERGYTSLFLDFHPEKGIPAGRVWERELYHKLHSCRAMIVLCSHGSMQSQWCFAEITHAKAQGKHVIPVRIEACEVPDILQDLQVIDLTKDAQAYERLWTSLGEHGLDPHDDFPWDGSRPPFPGLLAFQEADAGVFFGREDLIRDGIDALNRLRRFGAVRLLMVLGASGSGKSSLVRAGMLPRLRRDPERWLVLDPVRPQTDPVGAFAAVMERAYERAGKPLADDTLEARLLDLLAQDADEPLTRALEKMALDLRRATGTEDARLLLTLDQTEELLDASLGPERDVGLRLYRTLVECRGWRTIATLRSDFLGEFQRSPRLRDLGFESLSLSPLSAAELRGVITEPAVLTGLDIDGSLVDMLVDAALAQDALPLLAFALREIWERRDRDGRMRLEVFERDLQGLGGAIARTAEDLMSAARLDADDESRLRHAFLSLTRLGEDGQYSRRAQRWKDVDPRIEPRLRAFVQARLLVSRGEGDVGVVEVAHEELFRAWDRLAQWLHDDRAMLRARTRVEAAAVRWEQEKRHADFLLAPGRPLAEAEALLDGGEAELGPTERAFLQASVAARDAAAAVAWEAEQRRRRRARQLLWAGVGSLVLACALGVAVWMYLVAREAGEEAAAARDVASREARIAAEARDRATQAFEGEAKAAQRASLKAQEAEEARAQEAEARDRAMRAFEGEAKAAQRASLKAQEAEEARAQEAEARFETEILRRAHSALALAMEHESGSPEALRVALRAVLPDVARNRPPSHVAEEALRLAVKRMDRSLPLRGHEGPVARVALSHDGRRIATASDDGTAIVWSVADGTRLLRLGTEEGHGFRVHDVAFSPDDAQLATASGDHTARLWDAEAGQCLQVLEGHSGPVVQLCYAPAGGLLATASRDGTARLWGAESGELRHVLDDHGGPVVHVAWTPDGSAVATACWDGIVRLWDVETGRRLRFFQPRAGAANHVVFSAEGDQLLACFADGWARSWDPDTGRLLTTIGGHDGEALQASLAPMGAQYRPSVATVSSDGTARLQHSGQAAFELRGHAGALTSVAHSHSGELLLTTSEDGTIRVWRTRDGALLETLDGHGGRVTCAFFTDDDARVISSSVDGTAHIWRLVDSACLHVLAEHGNDVNGVRFSPDGRHVVTAAGDGTARLWNVADGTCVRVFRGHTGYVQTAAFSSDGATLVTASGDGTARLWNVETGACLWKTPPAAGPLRMAILSHDGRRLMTTSAPGNGAVWDVASGKQTQIFFNYESNAPRAALTRDGRRAVLVGGDGNAGLWRLPPVEAGPSAPERVHLYGHTRGVLDVAFSPDETIVATVSEDQTARLWDATTGACLHVLEGHDYRVLGVSFSPDGATLVTASADDSARVWRVSDGAHLLTLPHADDVTCAVFQPSDGTRIATSCWDGRVRLWSALDGRLLDELPGHADYVLDVSFSPDGRRFASASGDARIWSADLDDLLACARRLADPLLRAGAFEAREQAWLEEGDWHAFARSVLSPVTGDLAETSMIRFFPSLREGLREAQKTDRLVMVVLARYNPP